jgi:hypothetical protein
MRHSATENDKAMMTHKNKNAHQSDTVEWITRITDVKRIQVHLLNERDRPIHWDEKPEKEGWQRRQHSKTSLVK